MNIQTKAILNAYQQPMSIRDVARMFHMGDRRVRRIIKQHGVLRETLGAFKKWPPEHEAELARMWEEGLSANAIGRLLGVSKNSVVSKAHRLNLPGRASPIRPGKPKPTRVGLRRDKPSDAPNRIMPWRLNGHSVFHKCQWIEDEPSPDDSCKCGAETLPGRPYCEAHWRRSWIARQESEAA